jgi:hypothetical protein
MILRSQGEGAGRRLPPLSGFLVVALLAGGCAVGPDYSAEPRDDLAGKARVEQSHPSATPGHAKRDRKHRRPASGHSSASASATAAPTSGSAGPAGQPTGSASSGAVPPPAPGWSRAASYSDGVGDLGLTGGPSYADLTGVAVDDNGATARFTVTVAGRLPASLPNGEVEGIGLDLFRGGGNESDYQLFLDCGDGWRAFLQTPRGFIAFPGTLTVRDQSLVVEVPWSSIGGRSSVGLSAFADWSRDGTLVNDSSQDAAPNRGTSQVAVD